MRTKEHSRESGRDLQLRWESLSTGLYPRDLFFVEEWQEENHCLKETKRRHSKHLEQGGLVR